MKKNAILITLIVIIGIISISGCISDSDSDSDSDDSLFGTDYPANQGNVTPISSTLQLKYNDAKSARYIYKYTSGGSDPVYYDKKILEGSVKIDLTKVNWTNSHSDVELDSEPEDAKLQTDTKYAEEHFLKDIQKDFNSNLNKTCSITFYSENGTPVTLTDKSKGSSPFTKNMTLNNNTLTIKLYKNYQVNATTKIGNSGTYSGVLVINTRPKTHTITHAKLKINLYNAEYSYTLIANLNGKLFKMVQV